MSLAPGVKLGPYEIIARLGAGGMGEVYRTRDAKLGRDVAIKILSTAVAADPERIARFEREARVLAGLNHPHIAAVYGFQQSEGVDALVMELVDGPTLADRIARGRLPLDETLAVARQLVDALEAAHEKGIVHRDLKPANIKVRDDGTVKVLDFGLAKALDVIEREASAEPADGQHVADADRSHSARGDPRDGGVHVARAGARQTGRQARRHLGVRRRALRDDHRHARLRG